MSGFAKKMRLAIVSGGQTGVDRAALDAAMAAGLAVGGWCPAGRRALDGVIPARYPLRETPSSRYEQRTEWNVRDADATLILTRGEPSGGTRLTAELAARYGRPLLLVDLGDAPPLSRILGWLEENAVRVLNVAGPREEGAPGIGAQAEEYLKRLLQELNRLSAVDRGRARDSESVQRSALQLDTMVSKQS